ncbi:4Fe-4S dicluster domain protein [Mycobacterium xenopi 3993]|nr:4Fe-4S dicluster domain protein [Mycobacterium xenopi 3993]
MPARGRTGQPALVGTAEQGGVIDPDVLWSCVTCGACVEQCPVDIEHVDHIVDLRRYQVMMESEFPSELSVLFKNLETKANPWARTRPTAPTGSTRSTSTCRCTAKTSTASTGSSTCFGSAVRGLRRQGQEDHQGGR